MSKLEDALHEIAELGANTFAKYECKSRADLIRHMDKMYLVAFNALTDKEKDDNMSKPLEFICEDCGELDYVLINGYDFGDRLLEGVMFRGFPDGHVEIDPDSAEYFNDLNKTKWLKEAKQHLAEVVAMGDEVICSHCKGDVVVST